MAYHCDICANHLGAFRQGYADMITGSKPMTVSEIHNTPQEQDESGWWTAYYHGRGFAKAALVA